MLEAGMPDDLVLPMCICVSSAVSWAIIIFRMWCSSIEIIAKQRVFEPVNFAPVFSVWPLNIDRLSSPYFS